MAEAEAVLWATFCRRYIPWTPVQSTLILKRAKARGWDTANRLRRLSSEVSR